MADALCQNCRLLPELQDLSLCDNALGDGGVEALSRGVATSRSLTSLDLHAKSTKKWDPSTGQWVTKSSTKFGFLGARALASAIATNSSLKKV